MDLKLGDIVVHADVPNIVHLILEIDSKTKIFKTFVLSHYYKECVGEKFYFSDFEDYVRLKDMKL